MIEGFDKGFVFLVTNDEDLFNDGSDTDILMKQVEIITGKMVAGGQKMQTDQQPNGSFTQQVMY